MQINYNLMHLVIKNSLIKVFKLFIPLHINKIETLQLDIFLFKIQSVFFLLLEEEGRKMFSRFVKTFDAQC